MHTHSHTLEFKTKKFMEFIDITDKIEMVINKKKVKNGSVTVFSKHTTASIRINELEKGIWADFHNFIQKNLPTNEYYHHNDLTIRTQNLENPSSHTDFINGYSHCLHLIMGTSEHIPIIEGKLALGKWQRVFLIELDDSRSRQVLLQIIGE